VLAGALILGILANILLSEDVSSEETLKQQTQVATVLSPAKKLADFTLIQHTGDALNKAALKGKHSIVFFGFTNCPDICPATLHQFKQVKKNLQNAQLWSKLRVVFVTVDPERDTVEKMAQYVPYFDPEFIGATGTVEQVEQFTSLLSIPYELGDKNENGYYSVDHSATLILLDDDANIRALISPPFSPSQLSEDLFYILK